ncbi:hypothetical protein QA635_07725 [Bradyrhizobium brasilense]|uniref:hypothetical protein n=1 Tax=Bradyrhizobium brasilense TaxID=1419277 RepID=UPI0024B1C10C|nr:hypothetical protein [Bradyrhizobium australafricanum]WFU34311.1 hypothetical protein QA635_07725 [Bradyrhizobium australafricanum]
MTISGNAYHRTSSESLRAPDRQILVQASSHQGCDAVHHLLLLHVVYLGRPDPGSHRKFDDRPISVGDVDDRET